MNAPPQGIQLLARARRDGVGAIYSLAAEVVEAS